MAAVIIGGSDRARAIVVTAIGVSGSYGPGRGYLGIDGIYELFRQNPFAFWFAVLQPAITETLIDT